MQLDNFNYYIEEKESIATYLVRLEQHVRERVKSGKGIQNIEYIIMEAFEHSMMNERGLFLMRQITARYKKTEPTVKDLQDVKEWVRFKIRRIGKRDLESPKLPWDLKVQLEKEDYT